MLQWLRERIKKNAEMKGLSREMKASYEAIVKYGGSDHLCSVVLNTIESDQELKKYIESVGIRESLLPLDRPTITLAAINSLMRARKHLLIAPSPIDATFKLNQAQQVFRYSFFLFTDSEFAAEAEAQAHGIMQMLLEGKERPPSQYDERAKQAEKSLSVWMNADVTTFTFIPDGGF
ncbi:hypothetical protein QA644_27885 (plasmid) [Rhizobium sp. CC1099]|uniref:hypothetical protein n=1 Tax=Rhizobium sp. CC1099 TaxID=3039160 RepID=UPI0024B0869D|nr:hypothetical protein [Rhizobium sp. CC1099]WFU89870.1 hypothetical protein QA644_27885 [Rhizobium sp. CC1099]